VPHLHVAIAVLSGTTGGPATYGRRLVDHLVRLPDALRLSVLTDRPGHFPQPGLDVIELPCRGGIDRLRWQHVAVPRALRRLRPDVYHDTKNALPLGLAAPAVVTVHDLAYHTVPRTFGFWSGTFLRQATRDAVRRARVVVVPSLATAHDLRRIHPDCGDRIAVVPHGIDPAATPDAERLVDARRRLALPQRFVLHVGTVQARKNVDLVVQAVRTLRARGLPHRAVVVGRRGWLADAALREMGADDTALWLQHVDAADLAALYALADVFVSPSAYEGFGFAVADALAAGVPTVVSDVSSLPELCGDAAVRLAAITAPAITAALEPLLRDEERRRDLAARGRARAAAFPWSRAAAGHLDAYRRAAIH
jgi:glycosyltransferase involved in cell wall biosynthesis